MQNRTRIYLDNAATTPLDAQARAAMEPYFAASFGNASSPYAVSREARAAVDRARHQVAELIGARPDEIVFTSGGTESDNWALMGVALAHFETRGHIVVSSVEHHAVLEAAQMLREMNFDLDYARVDDQGVVSPQELEKLVWPGTRLVSMMAVNNETGVMQSLEAIAGVLRERDTLFHTDAVQAAGKIPLDVDALGVDLLTLSGHKFGGPKGVGALFIRRGTPMKSLLRGGAQERGRRAGTENVPAIVGMGAAAEIARLNLEANARHLHQLREHLERGLCEMRGAVINGSAAKRAPHITNVTLEGQRAEMLALNLDLRGFAVGTGSACASGALEPSHVLAAMGRDRETARASLRISLGVQNTQPEIDEFLGALRALVR